MMMDKILENAYHWIILHGPRIILSLVLLLAGQWVIHLLKRWLLKSLFKHREDTTLRPFMTGLITTTLQVILLLSVIQLLDIRMTIFAALVGSIGVAAGLALSGTLQNFTSGIIILLLKPYKAGDSIMAQGQTGIVSSIQLFNTIIITSDNRAVIIPNSKLSNEVIINNSSTTTRRIEIELKLSYAYAPETVMPLVLEEATHTPNVHKEPAPETLVSMLETDGWHLMVYAWTTQEQYDETKFDLNHRIINVLKKNEIKLPGM